MCLMGFGAALGAAVMAMRGQPQWRGLAAIAGIAWLLAALGALTQVIFERLGWPCSPYEFRRFAEEASRKPKRVGRADRETARGTDRREPRVPNDGANGHERAFSRRGGLWLGGLPNVLRRSHH
jgi:hypothetical protein